MVQPASWFNFHLMKPWLHTKCIPKYPLGRINEIYSAINTVTSGGDAFGWSATLP